MKWFFIYLMIFFFGLPEKVKVNLEINGIKKSGKLFLAIYDDPLIFESNKSEQLENKINVIAKLVEDVKIDVFKKSIYLPVGVYAVSFYIDSNNNQKLDYNFLGVPTEQFGFSNNAMGLFGSPSFDQASFRIDKESKITLKAR
ncbi:MAG: hypothetical protein CMC57_02590 [Flavobacteriaceae bacterium]|nr:hypothetical protein [Flavobacteriaceae bacterium]|tara:strand:- start:2269 stop:2697 length:429 start_codon:yes stop_codon:yes gene_type:complete